MKNRQSLILILVLAAVTLVNGALFTVSEGEYAAVFQFGEIRKSDYGPGLHFKLPFIQKVRRFDRRLLPLESRPERFLTSEKKNVQVDFYVKWRIKDVVAYYGAFSGGPQSRGLFSSAEEDRAKDRLLDITRKGLRSEFGKRTIQAAVSSDRNQIMSDIKVSINQQVAALGIEVTDVRIQRIDLPDEVAESVYERMRSERLRVAADLRAKGAEEAEKIRANADRERSIVSAKAFGDAERIRGEGDAKSAEIYARAYGRNPEFYSFYRSLDAYKQSFGNKGDVLVLEPSGEFFQYFNPSSSR